nr:reverse transcriptase domain, reverse transcriptase zinc-binding domain protein [Tanacetum cinerariifolium]
MLNYMYAFVTCSNLVPYISLYSLHSEITVIFILERHIQDNIILTQECLKGYNRKQGAKRCAMKIDIHKAYDTVSWKFLEDVLKEVDFHSVMVNWIMTYSLKVIKKSLDEFSSVSGLFLTIIKALSSLEAFWKRESESYSSKNYVRKFLRALHPKWRTKVTTIEESKDLTSLSLDELIGNLKVHEMIIKKDSEIVKAKGERRSLALKPKKESSDEECSTFGSKSHGGKRLQEVLQKKRKTRETTSERQKDVPKKECPKPPKDKNQRAFVEGSWSDSGEEDDKKVKDETCLIAQASNEICFGVDLKPDERIKDSRCSKHMMGNRKLFSTYKAYNGGNGQIILGFPTIPNMLSKKCLKGCLYRNDDPDVMNMVTNRFVEKQVAIVDASDLP